MRPFPFRTARRPLRAQHRARLRRHGRSRRRLGADPHQPTGVGVSGSVIGDDVLYIGGGRAVSMGGAGNMRKHQWASAGTTTLICRRHEHRRRCRTSWTNL